MKPPRTPTQLVLVTATVGLGLTGVAAGHAGDAPGAVLLGLLVVLASVGWYAPAARPWLLAGSGLGGGAAGASDDAPGAVLLGLLLVAAAVAMALVTARRTPA